MAYVPTTWADRSVQKPRTYTITDNHDGTNTLAASEGTVYVAGTAISAANLNHLETGLATIYNGNHNYGASAVGTDAYAIVFSPVYASYNTGMQFYMKVDVGNTGVATLAIDSLVAKNIKKILLTGKADIATGDMLAGGIYNLDYDGTDFILLNPSFSPDNERYHTDFAFENSTISNLSLTNGVLTKKANSSTPTTVTQATIENGLDLYANIGFGERLDGTFTATMDEIVYVTAYVTKSNATQPLICTIYDETSSTVLGSKSLAAASITTNANNTWTFATPVQVTRGHIIQIRFDMNGLGSVGASYSLYSKTSGTTSNAFLISTTNLWSTKTDSTTPDLVFSINYNTLTYYLTGTATKISTPYALTNYASLAITCADASANNSATVAIKDISDNVLSTTTLVNGINSINLSSINPSTYPALKIVYTISRNTGVDTAISLSSGVISWEDNNYSWKTISDKIYSGTYVQIDINVPSDYVDIELIVLDLLGDNVTPQTLNQRFNSDTGNNYTNAQAQIAFTTALSTGTKYSFRQSITNIVAYNKLITSSNKLMSGAATDPTVQYWANVVNAITTINLIAAANNIASCRIILRGRKG